MWTKSDDIEELEIAKTELENEREDMIADVSDILDLLDGYEEPNTEEAITRLKQFINTYSF